MIRNTLSLLLLCLFLLPGCMEYGDRVQEEFDTGKDFGDGSVPTGRGLFITNEGNFMYGNASLSYYDPESMRVENEVFVRANGFKLGDVAQSMIIHNGVGWVVVNNSGVIFAIDPDTFREIGRITGFTSPRHIHFLSDEKAYVTQLWDPRIYIVNPKTYGITGYIETDMDFESGSTEQMVQYGKYVFTNCWSYQNRILKIDTETDRVVGELTVGIQPTSLVMDCHDRLWTITDGGYEGSPYGYEAPTLCCIDAETFTVVKQFRFGLGDCPSEVPQRLARHALLDQQIGLAHGCRCGAHSGQTVPRIPQNIVLRIDRQSRKLRCLYRRRHRLRSARCGLSLFLRGKAARQIHGGNHPGLILLEINPHAMRHLQSSFVCGPPGRCGDQ